MFNTVEKAGRKVSNFIGALIGGPVLILVGGVVAFGFGKPIINDAKQSENWPTVAGEIVRSRVVNSRNSDGDKMYSAEIEYRYEVDGQEHKSNRVAFGGDGSSSSTSMAKKVTRRYPVGKTVDVYYDPDLPADSVLETGTSWSSYMVFGIGMAFLLIGFLVTASALFMLGGLLLGGAVLGGALAGMIGKKPGSTNGRRDTLRHDQPPRNDPAKDIDDDAFDIG